MARKKRTAQQKEVQDYRHDHRHPKKQSTRRYRRTRKNPRNTKTGIRLQSTPTAQPPIRSKRRGRSTSPSCSKSHSSENSPQRKPKPSPMPLRHHDPWLEWAGKQETKSFSIDPVALHIHERVSAKAILKGGRTPERPNVNLFADPQQSYGEAVDFYQHDVDWAKPSYPRRQSSL